MTRFLLLCQTLTALASASRAGDIDADPINYSTAPERNVVSRLVERLDGGKTSLAADEKHGYLPALLKELNVPTSSQVLVFSKTSLQRHRIAPRSPRALYFNDDVYVGYCRDGDVLELSAADPRLGTVFYTVSQRDADRATIARRGDVCMLCHASSQNQGLPGHLVRSVYPDRSGHPILASGTHRIDHTSPLKQRWGGWYVTGTSGKQTHLGNMTFEDRVDVDRVANPALNLKDLSKLVNTDDYLTPHSDIAALMVLEHQAQVHNLLARASIQTRQALHEEKELNKALNRRDDGLSESTRSRIRAAVEPLVRAMLFCGEAELTDPLEGTSTFAADFAKRGPFDKQGRTLRAFDLNTRMFKYPCSYLIYSDAFRGLPDEAKSLVWRRLWEVVSSQDESKEFTHLTGRDRRAIREIIAETVKDRPDYWK